MFRKTTFIRNSNRQEPLKFIYFISSVSGKKLTQANQKAVIVGFIFKLTVPSDIATPVLAFHFIFPLAIDIIFSETYKDAESLSSSPSNINAEIVAPSGLNITIIDAAESGI